MNRRVSRFHLIVRTPIGGGRDSARRSHSIAALHELNAACDLELASDANIMVKHHIQTSFALEARVELIKQFADPDGEIRHSRAAAHDGDRLFGNLPYFDRVWHDADSIRFCKYCALTNSSYVQPIL